MAGTSRAGGRHGKHGQALRGHRAQGDGFQRAIDKRADTAVGYLIPWLLVVMWFVATFVLRLAFHRWALIAGPALVASTVTLVIIARHVTHERGHIGRRHVVGNVAGGMTFVTATVTFGWNGYLTVLAIIAGMTTALAWNMRHTKHTADTDTGEVRELAAASDKKWTEFTEQYMPDLVNVTATRLHDDKQRTVVGLDLPPDVLPQHIQEKLPYIGRVYGAIRGGANMAVDEFGKKVLLMLNKQDPLKEPTDWPGPSAPGESCIEPLNFGPYANGTICSMVLPHRDNPPKVGFSMLVSGAPGAGKTDAENMELADLLTRTDGAVIYLDTVKGEQSSGVLADDVELYTSDKAIARAVLKRLVDNVIPARGNYLAELGKQRKGIPYANWFPGCGLSFLVVNVQEAADMAGNEQMTKVAERCRSLGIMLQPSLQRWHHERADTSLREACTAAWCFGMSSPESTKMVLPADIMQQLDDAENGPWHWGGDTPGKAILTGPGVPNERRAMAMRTYRHHGHELVAALEEYRHLRQPLDRVTAEAFGDVLAKFRAEHPRPERRLAVPGHDFMLPGTTVLDQTTPTAATTPPVPTAGQEPVQVPGADAPAVTPRPEPAITGEVEDTEMEIERPEDVGAFRVDADDEDTRAEDLEDAGYALADAAGGDVELLAEAARALRDAAANRDRLDDEIDAATEDEDDEDEARPADDFEFPTVVEARREEAEADARRGRKLTKEEKIRILIDILRDVVGPGNNFTPKDVYAEFHRRIGGADSWVRQQMSTLLDRGVVEICETGGYTLLTEDPSPNTESDAA